MKLHCLQHVPFEGLARIQDWADSHRHPIRVTHLFAGETLPPLQEVDGLMVMGGPMGVHDDHCFSWMVAEKKYIEQAIRADKAVLGVCLGAQLIAHVLGAQVSANREKEIGWFPIELNPPNVRNHPLNVLSQRTTVLRWHGDTFAIPQGAVHLARSRACENQAFGYGPQVVGLQFHLEIGFPQIERLVRQASHDLTEGSFVQDPQEMIALASSYAPPLNAALFRFLDAFLTQTKIIRES